jgi:hypothetical protein
MGEHASRISDDYDALVLDRFAITAHSDIGTVRASESAPSTRVAGMLEVTHLSSAGAQGCPSPTSRAATRATPPTSAARTHLDFQTALADYLTTLSSAPGPRLRRNDQIVIDPIDEKADGPGRRP